jgi:hypothetical protein
MGGHMSRNATSIPYLGFAVRVTAICAMTLAMIACSESADVTREELVSVTERDGVAFDEETIPAEVLDRLALNQVVVLGETHHLREHWAFVATVLQDLHSRGFRQLLFEAPHMADWLFDDYVTGGEIEPRWSPPGFYEKRLAAIREFNLTLPPEERIHVRAIDVNEEHHGGAQAFRSQLVKAARHLPDSDVIDEFMKVNVTQHTAEVEAIESLLTALEDQRDSLIDSWGRSWYAIVVEMAEVERASIDIRADRKSDDGRAARAREDVIKELADARIGEVSGGTVINIGGHHAQKAHMMGTNQEWLGDYLVHRSSAVDGSVIVLNISSARTELEPGAEGTPFDVIDTSPENELLRVMAETWPGRTVFMPLDDPIFSEHTVAFNSEETIYVTSLNEQFDAVLQYGLAHRMPTY